MRVVRATAAILIAVPLMVTGVAAAAGPSTVISACYSPQTNSSLRVIADGATCRANETLLTWNQQGPTGPAGPAGPEGPKGDPGPAGTGAVTAYSANGAATGIGHLAAVDILTRSVPAGTYVINVSVTVEASVEDQTWSPDVHCSLRSNGLELAATVSNPGNRFSNGKDFRGQASMAITTLTTSTDPAVLTVNCGQEWANWADFTARLTAISAASGN